MVRSFPGHASPNVIPLSSKAGVGRGCSFRQTTRRLAGLSLEEATEFEALDALPPFDDDGNVGWTFEGDPTSHREKRWLMLYNKHVQALTAARQWPTSIDRTIHHAQNLPSRNSRT